MTLAAFVNPHNANADNQSADLKEGARALGLQLQIENPSSERDLEEAVTRVAQIRAGGLVVAADPFFFSQHNQLIGLTARHKLPAIYEWREFVEAGGLSSYGTSLAEAYRQTGIYTGQILKGATRAELPVTQAVKFEFLINLRTAKALGIDVPPGLSARADEIIE